MDAVLERFSRCLGVELGQSPHTVNGYLCDVRQCVAFLAERIGRAPDLTDFTPELLQEWLNGVSTKQGRPAHPRTKQRKKAALSRFFRFLVQAGLAQQNPVTALRVPKSPRRNPTFLTERDAMRLVRAPLECPPVHDVIQLVSRALRAPSMKEAGRLIAAHVPRGDPDIWQLHDSAVLHLLYGGGLRAGEIGADEVRGLLMNNILLDTPEPGQVAVRVIGKGDKERLVPLADAAAAMIVEYLARRDEIPRAAACTYAFLSRRTIGVRKGERRPLTRKGVYLLVRRYGAALGLKVYPHLLRHSCATHMLWGGCDLAAVQDQLGHADPATTRLYASLDLPRLREQGVARHPLSRRDDESAESAPTLGTSWREQKVLA